MNLLTKEWNNGKDAGILLLRFMLGFFLVYNHGWGKLSVIFSGQEIQFMDPIGIGASLSYYLAAFAEGIAGLLILIGLFTRPAAIMLIINFMVIIYFHTTMGDKILGLELQLFFLLGFATLLISGPGKFSLDSKLFAKEK